MRPTALIPSPALSEQRLEHVEQQLGTAVRRHRTAQITLSPEASAKAVGLRYSTDTQQGIKRIRKGKGVAYRSADGTVLKDKKTLQRIHSLVIPPAWTDVWICPDAQGHLQATGRDAKGRKQYRYHPLWRSVRDLTKYHRMVPFGEALPRIRSAIERHLQEPGLHRRKVLATVVRLLEETLIRVGNEEYAQENGSYGLTTLHDSHVRIRGSDLTFRFRGKSGKHHDITLHDPRLAPLVRKCRDLPGQELFQYTEKGALHRVTSEDVNAYIHEIAGDEFTAKDFRTWAGTVCAALALRGLPPCTSKTQTKRNIVRAVEQTAQKLGNTPAVCRKSYVHPFVLDSYEQCSLLDNLEKHYVRARKERKTGLTYGEAAVLALLKECFTK